MIYSPKCGADITVEKVDLGRVIAELEDIKKKIENDEFKDLFYKMMSEAVEVTKKKLESGELYEAWKRMALAYIRYQIEIVRNHFDTFFTSTQIERFI